MFKLKWLTTWIHTVNKPVDQYYLIDSYANWTTYSISSLAVRYSTFKIYEETLQFRLWTEICFLARLPSPGFTRHTIQ